MIARESKRSRHLIVRLTRGDELPQALVRALDEAEARSAWISGIGAVEAAEIAVYDQASRSYKKTRRIDGGGEVLSIQGNAATLDGTTTARLSVTLARETDAGLQTLGGQLVWARAFDLELLVTVLDDVSLTRMADDATGLPGLVARSTAVNAIPAELRAPVERAATPERSPPADRPSAPAAVPQHAAPTAVTPMFEAPAIPQRPVKPRDDLEVIYPEVGDRVTHFAFGECTVVSSDGDRIRLQQDKDGRVREVALAMLKIEEPTELEDGKKHFKLIRKN